MKNIEILAQFEKEIGAIDQIDKPSTEDSLGWIHLAMYKFAKTRANGDNVHGTGVEQTEKRTIDLSRLFESKSYDYKKSDTLEKPEDGPLEKTKSDILEKPEDDTLEKSDMTYNDCGQYGSYTVIYPDKLLYVLNEDVTIANLKGENDFNTFVFECTRDSFMPRINNSLTDFHYNYGKARPIRVRTNSGCELYTDKQYMIKNYTIGYIREPNKITLQTREEALREYSDFEESTLYEIIKMAAQMYLENTKNERYKTISEEVLTQE